MLRFKFAFVGAALVLASCAHSGSLPPAPTENSARTNPESSNILPPQSPWRFFNTPTTGTGLAQDQSHNTWFFSSNTSISKINLSGRVTTFSIPAAGSDPVFGNDGAIWFIAGSKIGRVTSTGSSSYFDANGFPSALTAGFNDDVWFGEQPPGNGQFPSPQPVIAHMTRNGTVTTHQQPTDLCPQGQPPCDIFGITRGPDGNIWFSGKIEFCPFCGLLGKVNPVTGAITLRGTFVAVGNLVVGPDKRLWGIGQEPGPEGNQQHLVGFETNFALTKDYLLANGGTGLVAGRDALYLISGAALQRVTTGGQITTFTPPAQIPCCPNALSASGPGDDLWFSTPGGVGVLTQTSHP